MHVPQARDEVTARCIDGVGIVRYLNAVGGADGRNAAARDENSLSGTERAVPDIDDRNILDGHDPGRRLRAGGEQQARETRRDLHDLTT